MGTSTRVSFACVEIVDVADVRRHEAELPVARRVLDRLHLLVRREREEEGHAERRIVFHDRVPETERARVEGGP
jgi:hypothetical protein